MFRIMVTNIIKSNRRKKRSIDENITLCRHTYTIYALRYTHMNIHTFCIGLGSPTCANNRQMDCVVVAALILVVVVELKRQCKRQRKRANAQRTKLGWGDDTYKIHINYRYCLILYSVIMKWLFVNSMIWSLRRTYILNEMKTQCSNNKCHRFSSLSLNLNNSDSKSNAKEKRPFKSELFKQYGISTDGRKNGNNWVVKFNLKKFAKFFHKTNKRNAIIFCYGCLFCLCQYFSLNFFLFRSTF